MVVGCFLLYTYVHALLHVNDLHVTYSVCTSIGTTGTMVGILIHMHVYVYARYAC